MPRRRAFAQVLDLEFAFAEFESRHGHPYAGAESELGWGKVRCSSRIDYAKGFNDFTAIVPEGRFPPRSQFLVFCALQVYGRAAASRWSTSSQRALVSASRGSAADNPNARANAADPSRRMWVPRLGPWQRCQIKKKLASYIRLKLAARPRTSTI